MAPRCYLLELPLELRLEIYECALEDSQEITITSGHIDTSSAPGSNCIRQRIANVEEGKPAAFNLSGVLGLPFAHFPIIRNPHDPALLSMLAPPTVHAYPSEGSTDANSLLNLTSLALLQASKQTNLELNSRFSSRLTPHVNLHISYPYGLLVLKSLCPSYLRHTRKIFISGQYLSTKDKDALSPSPDTDPTAADAVKSALGNLVRACFSPDGHPTVRELELRIWYPDEDRYQDVWADEASPTCVVFWNTCGGDIDLNVSRGRKGTALKMVVRPDPEKRVVSSVFKKIDVGAEEAFLKGEDVGL